MADVLSSPFRFYLEIRKMHWQLNFKEISLKQQYSAFKLAYIPFVLRDVFFRVIYESIYHITVFSEMHRRNKEKKKLGIPIINDVQNEIQFEESQAQHRRQGLFIIAALFAAILTMPLDVMVTKLATQQSNRYKGFFHGIKTVAAQEGKSKLISGLGARTSYFFIQGTMMLWLTPHLRPIFEEAYNL